MGCCCCWRTRPASGLFAPTSRSTPARCRQQPGGHIALLPSHWQTAACTLQPVWGLGAFGRAAAVAVVPGSWFEPWPGNSGPLAMWAAARGRASPLSVSCRPWGPGAQTPRALGGPQRGHSRPARGRASPLSVSCRPWGPGAQTPRLSAGLVLRPPPLSAGLGRDTRGPCCLQALPAVGLGRVRVPRELGVHLLKRFVLRDQGFSMLSLCRVGDGLCVVWFLDLAVSAGPEAPGSRETREGHL